MYILYFPSDILKNYKNIQLQLAILEYLAIDRGKTQNHWPDFIIAFTRHIDKTVCEITDDRDITKAANLLIAIKLNKVENNKVVITEEGIKCLQSYTLQAATLSTRVSFISHTNWIICTLISLTAIAISILK